MKKLFTVLIAAVAVCAVALAASAKESALVKPEGHYFILPTDAKALPKGQSEAALYFWYGCGACKTMFTEMDKAGNKWLAGAKLLRFPVTGNEAIDLHAQIYLALKKLGVPDKTHLAVFKAFAEGKGANKYEDLPALAREIKVSPKEFMEAYTSLEVRDEMAGLKKLPALPYVTNVPSMVIDGYYFFDASMVPGPKGFMAMSTYLLNLGK